MKIKILSEENFTVDSVHHNTRELQRLVDTKSTGANIHNMRNAICIVYGYIHLLQNKTKNIPQYLTNTFKEKLDYIIKNTRQ